MKSIKILLFTIIFCVTAVLFIQILQTVYIMKLKSVIEELNGDLSDYLSGRYTGRVGEFVGKMENKKGVK